MPLLSTVKSKTAATSAPSASASTAPASQAPASQAPSAATDVSAAPSADPSAVPSADVSASPSADVSAEPSVEPSKEPSVVTEIKIDDQDALLDPDNKRIAYAHYDVFDQYGESMRSRVSINWTSSNGTVKADKSSGQLKITKDAKADEFMYGSLLYIVGVDVSSGKSANAQLKIGMERAIATIDFDGFVQKSNKPTKKADIPQTLPADFAKNDWVMLYTAKDQNGHEVQAADNNIDSNKLTFIADNPKLLDPTFEDSAIVTIEGTDYNTVAVQPGMYVDQGGDVTITAISNKTGQQSSKVFTVGKGGLLQKLEILGPINSYSSKKTVTVADGDKNVVLDYEALDENGNSVTSYETIVRSTKSLILSAGQGTLTIKQEDDGSAGIYWSDEKTVDFNESEFFNTVARPVALSVTVVGGDSKTTMLNVEDARRPAEITSVAYGDYGSKALAVGTTGVKFAVGDKVSFKDQYGDAMDKAVAKDFFAKTAPNAGTYGTDSSYYGIRRKTNETNKLSIVDIDNVFTGDGWWGPMTAVTEGKAGGSVVANSLKWTIAKIKKADYENLKAADQTVGSNWDDDSKVYSDTLYTADVDGVHTKDIALADFKTVGVGTYYTNSANGELIDKAEKENYAASASATGSAVDTSEAAFKLAKAADPVVKAGTLRKNTEKALETLKVDKVGCGETGSISMWGGNPKAGSLIAVARAVLMDGTLSTWFEANKGTDAAQQKAFTDAVNALRDTINGGVYEVGSDGTKNAGYWFATDETTKKDAENDNAIAKKIKANVTALNNAADALSGGAGTSPNGDVYKEVKKIEDALADAISAQDALINAIAAEVENDSYELTDAAIETAYDEAYAAWKADAIKDETALTVEYGKGNGKIEVTGMIEGNKVGIPAKYWELTDDAVVTLGDGDYKVCVAEVSGLKWSDLYDMNSAKNLRKTTTVSVGVNVYNTMVAKDQGKETLITTPKKSLTVTDGAPKPASVAFDTTTKNAENLAIKSGSFTLKVTDQYGDAVSDFTSIINVTLTKENDGEFAHLNKSFSVAKNGTKDVAISGAELGDTFTVVGTIEGYPELTTGDKELTVGADKNAYITNKSSDVDKALRELLGYGR